MEKRNVDYESHFEQLKPAMREISNAHTTGVRTLIQTGLAHAHHHPRLQRQTGFP